MTVKPSELSVSLDEAQEAIGKLDYPKANQLLAGVIQHHIDVHPPGSRFARVIDDTNELQLFTVIDQLVFADA